MPEMMPLSKQGPPLWTADPGILWRNAADVAAFVPQTLDSNKGVNALSRGVFFLVTAYVLYYMLVVPDGGLKHMEMWPIVLGAVTVIAATMKQQTRQVQRMSVLVRLLKQQKKQQQAQQRQAVAAMTADDEAAATLAAPSMMPPVRPVESLDNPPWWPKTASLVPMDPFASRYGAPTDPSTAAQPDLLTPAQSSLAATEDNPYGNYRLYDDAPSQVYTGPVGMPPDDTISRMVDGTTFQNPGHIWYTRPDPSGFEHLHAPVSQTMYGTHHTQAEEGWAPGGLWFGRR